MIIIHYASGTSYGEKWGDNSYIQLVGFVLLTFGTMTYNKVLPLERIVNKIRGRPEGEPVDEGSEQQGSEGEGEGAEKNADKDKELAPLLHDQE